MKLSELKQIPNENEQVRFKLPDGLAKDKWGIPKSKPKINLAELANQESCCSPESGCC